MKGQGSTEYLVVLGAVIALSLLAATLLGYFADTSPMARAERSRAYWAGPAQPFGIYDAVYRYNGSGASNWTGGVHLVMKNKDKYLQNISRIILNGNSSTFCVSGSAAGAPFLLFNPGQERTVAVIDGSGRMCLSNGTAFARLALNHSSPFINGSLQNGSLALAVSCT